MNIDQRVKHWEKVGFQQAQNDPENWVKSLQNISETCRLKNEADIVKKSAEGRLVQQRVNETTAELNARGGAPSMIGVHANLVSAGFHDLAAIGFFTASFFMTRWAIAPFRLDERLAYAVAGSTAMAGAILFERLLEKLSERFPKEDIGVLEIFLSASGIVLLFCAVFNLASLRGLKLGVAGSEDVIQGAGKFFQVGGKFITIGFILIAFLSEIGSALCFFAAKSKFSASLPVFMKRRGLQRDQATLKLLAQEITFLKNEPKIVIEAGTIGARRALSGQRLRDSQAEAKRRLVRNLLLYVVGLLIFLLLVSRALGNETTVVLKDLTASSQETTFAGVSAFELNKEAIGAYLSGINLGLDLYIIGVHEESFAKPAVILRARIKNDPGYFGEIIAQERKKVLDQWKKVSANLKPEARRSDYLGAFRLAGEILKGHSDSKGTVLVFGDMLQATRQLDLETPRAINQKFIDGAMKQLFIPDLKGAIVKVYGAGGRDEAHIDGVRAFWLTWLKACQARVETYTNLREVQP